MIEKGKNNRKKNGREIEVEKGKETIMGRRRDTSLSAFSAKRKKLKMEMDQPKRKER